MRLVERKMKLISKRVQSISQNSRNYSPSVSFSLLSSKDQFNPNQIKVKPNGSQTNQSFRHLSGSVDPRKEMHCRTVTEETDDEKTKKGQIKVGSNIFSQKLV